MSESSGLPPEQDAVRRLLADARHDGPPPPDVADRLDETLASLVAERHAGDDDGGSGQQADTRHAASAGAEVDEASRRAVVVPGRGPGGVVGGEPARALGHQGGGPARTGDVAAPERVERRELLTTGGALPPKGGDLVVEVGVRRREARHAGEGGGSRALQRLRRGLGGGAGVRTGVGARPPGVGGPLERRVGLRARSRVRGVVATAGEGLTERDTRDDDGRGGQQADARHAASAGAEVDDASG